MEPTAKRHKPNDSDDELPLYMLEAEEAYVSRNETLYLDTINRAALDFDFEKMCLISLSTVGVYSCLVCGQYLQGRSVNSHAYNHSVNEDHHVYVHLETKRFFVLPENYEITDSNILKSFEDIKLAIDPVFTKEELYHKVTIKKDLQGKPYTVGYVGLNNISKNDYSNVCLQLLAHIDEVRDFYLKNTKVAPVELHQKFGLLVRKLWSPHLYKGHVSPHEVLQHISSITKKKFPIIEQKSPKNFLVWLINQLHAQQAKYTKKHTVFSKLLQGEVEVTSTKLNAKENKVSKKVEFAIDETSKKLILTKFWILSLTLPPTPLFQSSYVDPTGKTIHQVPQVSILQLLKKYDGVTTTEVNNELKTYKLLKLPEYLLLHIDRDIEDGSARGNDTVVKFPDVLDMSPYTDKDYKYELVANVKHEVKTGETIDRKDDTSQWSISVPKYDGSWVTLTDLKVEPCERELLFLDESYIQLWKRC